jgi:hypothetical protein
MAMPCRIGDWKQVGDPQSSLRFRFSIARGDAPSRYSLLFHERVCGPRAAFVSFDSPSVVASLPLRRDPPVLWNGIETKRGELVVHPQRDSFHHLTHGESRWDL